MLSSSWRRVTPVVLSSLLACGSSEDGFYEGLAPPGALGRPDSGPGSSSGQAPSASGSSGGGGTASSSSGGGGSSGGSSSGEPATPSCSLSASYKPIQPVAGLPTSAREPSFTGNELVAYFVQVGEPVQRVYAASRGSRNEPFGTPVQLGPTVNERGSILHVFVKDDGLELYFTRDDGGRQLYVARRDAIGENFRAAELFRGNATNELYVRDGSARFFSRSRDGYWEMQAVRPATADESNLQPFGHPQMADGWIVASVYPAWFEEGSNTLWFYSQEIRPAGIGGLLRREGTRSSQWNPATSTWSQPVAAEHRVVWISPDSCRLYSVTDSGIAMRERVATP